jgi:hypothetical protein
VEFLNRFSAAAVLVALTLVLQCAGVAVLIVWGRARFERERRIFGAARATRLMFFLMSVIIVLHAAEVLLWSGFYRLRCFSSWEPAFYFSAANYTTVGAGDLFLPASWRVLGPVESIVGVLMCGLSASFLFAVVTRLVEHDDRIETGNQSGVSGHGRRGSSLQAEQMLNGTATSLNA